MDKHYPILIVEDSEEDRGIILEAFSVIKKTHLIKFMHSGEELLQYAGSIVQDQHPSLIVLDYYLPLLDGKETMYRIRANNWLKEVPVVIFSCRPVPVAKKEMQQLNVLTCLQKATNILKLAEQARFFTELIADDVDTLLGLN